MGFKEKLIVTVAGTKLLWLLQAASVAPGSPLSPWLWALCPRGPLKSLDCAKTLAFIHS